MDIFYTLGHLSSEDSSPYIVYGMYFVIDRFIYQFFGLQNASMPFPLYYGIQQSPPSPHGQ